jgi:alpha-amylase
MKDFDKLGINYLVYTNSRTNTHCWWRNWFNLFHGYWTRDWTALDPNFGTNEDLANLVKKAHAHGIRIVLDSVINHTGNWSRYRLAKLLGSYKSLPATIKTMTTPLFVRLLLTWHSNRESTQTWLTSFPCREMEEWRSIRSEVAELDAFFKERAIQEHRATIS